MADKVTFATNIIQELALQYPEGKEVQSSFAPDGKQVMFTLADGRVMFLNTTVAERVARLGLAPQEPFEIGRTEKVEGNRKRVEWHIAKVGFAPDEKPAAAATASQAQATAPVNGNGSTPKPLNHNGNGNGHANGNGSGNGSLPHSPLEHTGWANYLREQAQVLIDIYATCLHYASQQYGNQIKPEDVRALVTSAYINITKGGPR